VLYKQQSPDPKQHCFIVYSSRAHARPPTATAFVATAPRVVLIFVARIVNIVSCNKIFFFHGLPSTLLQLFYFKRFAEQHISSFQAFDVKMSCCKRALIVAVFPFQLQEDRLKTAAEDSTLLDTNVTTTTVTMTSSSFDDKTPLKPVSQN
jgi:hypothetical protein